MDTNTQKPLVSVNICTYNRADLLSKALESVLAQNYTNLEILVLDDHSTDDTESVVLSYTNKHNNIHYFKNSSNLGITKNRNLGLEKSSGKYIAVLDSDDYWLDENKISEQVDFLQANSDYALVGTYTKVVDSDDKEITILKPELNDLNIRNKILLQNQFIHSSVLFKKDSLKSYNENYFIWEDYSAWLEIGKNHKFANIPKIYTAYKKHSSNISQSKKISGALTLEKIIKDNKKYYPNYFKAIIKNKLRLLRSIL